MKLRRSRLWWITVSAFTVAGAMGAMFMFIGQDPQRARSLGLLGAKAQLADIDADWAGYLALLSQIAAVGGALIFGMVAIWTFGREFSDHTAKDLLALPTPRRSIVVGKFAVVAAWCGALTGYLYGLGLALGAVLRLPGWSADVAVRGFGRLIAAAAMTILLTAVFALAASVGRGYLPAVGALFAAVFLAQILAALGYGRYFPFSVPALSSGLAGADPAAPGPLSYGIVVATGLAAMIATSVWWERADQHG